MKRALIINQGHTDNVGDQIIADMIRRRLLERGCTTLSLPFWDRSKVFHGILSKTNIIARYMREFILRFPVLLDMLNYIAIKRVIAINHGLSYDFAIIGGASY